MSIEVKMPAEVPATIESKLAAFSVANEQVMKAIEALAPYQVINSKEDSEKALEVMKSASKVEKIIEAKRKELVGPLNDEVKQINDKAKLLTAQVSVKINLTKQAVIDWKKLEDLRIWEETKRAREKQLAEMGMSLDASMMFYVHEQTGTKMPARYVAAPEPSIWAAYVQATTDNINQAVIDMQKALEVEAEELEFFGTDEDKAEVTEKLESLTTVEHTAPSFFSTAPAKVKGSGKRWVFVVDQPSLVPRDYLEVNETKIRKAVADGVRLIPGVRIYQEDTLSLR